MDNKIKCNCDFCGSEQFVNSKTYKRNLNKNNGKYKCRKCSAKDRKLYDKSFAEWGIENICKDFIDKYWDNDNNIEDPFKLSYGSGIKVWIKCQEKDYHGSYEITCNKFTTGRRCPYCNRNSGRVHKMDSIGQYILDKYGEDFLNSVCDSETKCNMFAYNKNMHTPIKWKCNKHGVYFRNGTDSITCEFRCPICSQERSESLLQEKVRKYICLLGYSLKHEYNCSIIPINPKTKHKLPFDNEIQELKLIVEVNGHQHYNIDFFHMLRANKINSTPEEEFEYCKWKDEYKKQYALEKGYEYLEIPYWTDDKEETYKKLIDKKISEIIN